MSLTDAALRYTSGVGLGLMLARGLTEAMGGSLSIRDADSGTTATVMLRAAEPSPDSSG